jgi:recombinational DNA repair protein (RecF pathway)
VHLLAKGARRGKWAQAAGLEPFCLLEVLYMDKEDRDLHTLRDSDLLRSNGAFRGDLVRWAAGSLVLEMIDRASSGEGESGGLFDLAMAFVEEAERLAAEGEKQNSTAAVIAALLPFAWAVFRLQGIAPQIGRCIISGVTKGPFPFLDVERGGVVAKSALADHSSGAGSLVKIDEGLRRILISWLMEWPLPRGERAAPPPAIRLSTRQMQQLLELLNRLAAWHFEGPLKSAPMLKRLL